MQKAPNSAAQGNPLDHRYQGEHPVRTLAYLFRPYRSRLIAAVAIFCVRHSPLWLLPLITANIIDIVVQHKPLGDLWVNAAILAVMFTLNYPATIGFARLMSGSIRRVGTSLRSALCGRMQQLSIGYHSKTSAGVLQAKVVRDVDAIEESARQTAELGLGAITTLIGGLVVIGFKAPVFLPVFLVVVPAASLLIRYLRSRVRSHNESFRREVELVSSRVTEMTSLIHITRAHGLERTALGRVDGALLRLRSAGQRLDILNGRIGSLAWIMLNALGMVCLIGAALVAYHGWLDVTAGDIVMLSTFFTTLTASMNALMGLTPILSKGLESVRSIGEVLQAPDLETNAGKHELPRLHGRIDFQDVEFRYEGADTPSISGFELSARPGETVALVGPSGAGKSTVLNLLIGFIRPTGGRILLDGTDAADLDLRTYRRFLSVVPQESILFDGTIRDNVTYGLDDTDDEALVEALRAANAWEFVQRLPHGLETLVGERGALLSGGQRQRLAIARALIRDPRVLILDEATSALDGRSETLVQEAMGRLMAGRTVFVVAHRLSTIRGADRIVVMDQGRIREVGRHDELLALGGLYTQLGPGQVA
ncbi:ABC transporter ATP-binding protein [Streptomyces avicenniae]|uniref:ABC transporter ATP-binding protein n=1 Tax=Streptomyces avicenniae TaxID=500153 RepID=UPI00069C3759|nr:ABC transporter ATP-binding protein [Streptomyces avicenniae]